MATLILAADARKAVDDAKVKAANQRHEIGMAAVKAAINKAVSEQHYSATCYNLPDSVINELRTAEYKVQISNEFGWARVVVINWGVTMNETPLHEREETQLVLYLNNSHMPRLAGYRSDAVAGSQLTYADGDYTGTVICVVDPDVIEDGDIDSWLLPIMRYAYDNCYSLIWFTQHADCVSYFPTYS